MDEKNLLPEPGDIITLEDDEGNGESFEFLDCVQWRNRNFAILAPILLEGEEDQGDVLILEIADDGAYLSTDDIAANRAYNVFKEKHKDDYKFI